MSRLSVSYSSSFPFRADEVFHQFCRPGALERMLPPWREVKRVSPFAPPSEVGSRVELCGKWGFFPVSMTVEHVSFSQAEHTFVDRQVIGPFRFWEHRHTVIPKGENKCELLDEISFELPCFSSRVKREIEAMLRYRHFTLLKDLELFSHYQKEPQKVLICGGSGFIGSALIPFLEFAGFEVTSLVRSMKQKGIYWSPEKKICDVKKLEGFDVVINLCGANIAEHLWSEKRKALLKSSRIETTRYLSDLLMQLSSPPKVVISASAIGYYGNQRESVDEQSGCGEGFLADLCREWEHATDPLEEKGVRVVHPRFGTVLHPQGGMLKRLIPLFRCGLGSPLGSGDQMMSFIALDDLLGGMYHLIREEQINGAVNFTTPYPLTNREFSKELASRLNRWTFFPLPEKVIRLVFREMGEALFLSSCCALPKSLLQSGYVFRYPSLKQIH